MTPARLQKIEEIFHAALDQEPDQISAFLKTACEGDELLRRKVEALVASHQRPSSFIETSAVDLATKIIQNGRADLLVGQTIGHYKLTKRIGSGGMGDVYLAADITAGRKAALKLLPVRFTGDAERLKRFQQEAHAVVGLNHPNILTVYEIGEDHSIHYIASELIEGETLRQRLMQGRMQLSEAVDIAIQVVSALAVAHAAGIVHRDIKPENIMLRPDGYVKVLDFGIAKLAEQEVPVAIPTDEALSLVETNLGSILGTVRYMSPEQARGAQIDKRTDVWSLGVVLYEMVTAHAPFTGETPGEVMTSILETEPAPLTSCITHTPAELQQIISRTLRKERGERYQGAHQLLEALKELRHKLEVHAELARSTPAPSWLRWARSPTALVLVLLVAALALALPFYRHQNLTISSPPEKSIAVLPFESLSEEEENAFFADGVQDEILTNLARIADLKVISRASVMQYKSAVARNLTEIGRQLRVAHVVEGSVQRAGNRVRVNAQLIDTRTDRQLWGQTYDRDLADVFTIQSEIAMAIARQLQARLLPREKNAIEQAPTENITAFEFYTRANNLLASLDSNAKAKLLEAADLLNQAIASDPSFFRAHCRLAYTHDQLYFLGHDHTPARLAMAEAAIQAASRLRPDAGETHLARAENLYRGYLDYDGALAELEIARQTLPNNVRVFQLIGFIQRRRGHWEESIGNLERAGDLDPHNISTPQQIALSYGVLYRYAEEKLALDRALAIDPNDAVTKVALAAVQFHWKADTRALHQTIDSIRGTNPGVLPSVGYDWLSCALAERDVDEARNALNALSDIPMTDYNVHLNRPLMEGVIARMTKDDGKTRAAFGAARAVQEKIVQAQPSYGPALCVLGLIDAGLGRKDEALREGRHAVDLMPVAKDAINGPLMIEYLAMTAAWAGDKDLACEQLTIATRPPSTVTYGQLKLLPFWDPLRGDPRFEKLVASLAPKR
jgi:serine/threonine protein kinase/tetratricopeptide (TPR) repeat protein